MTHRSGAKAKATKANRELPKTCPSALYITYLDSERVTQASGYQPIGIHKVVFLAFRLAGIRSLA